MKACGVWGTVVLGWTRMPVFTEVLSGLQQVHGMASPGSRSAPCLHHGVPHTTSCSCSVFRMFFNSVSFYIIFRGKVAWFMSKLNTLPGFLICPFA